MKTILSPGRRPLLALLTLAAIAGARCWAEDPKAPVEAATPPAANEAPQEADEKAAKAAASPSPAEASRVTLDVTDAPLAEVLASLEKQTGNRLSDYREKFNQPTTEKKVTLDIQNQPFWTAVDRLLDDVQMSPYPLSGEESLALVEREPGALRRFGRAAYTGPFRIEATSISAERGLRVPETSIVRVELELSWEPRLAPLAITQKADEVHAVGDDDLEVPVAVPQGSAFDVDVTPGSQAADATLPLQLPSRKTIMLRSLRGKLNALVPGKMAELQFNNLAVAQDVVQDAGGITVTLDRVVQNQELWEVHMRLGFKNAEELADHRGWVFQNLTYLIDKQGEKLDHAGYETTMESDEESGFAYLFELPEGKKISDYSWIYRTPADVKAIELDYELQDVPLP